MSSKTWDDDFVRQVPSFQWIIDQSLEDEVEAASLQVQEPADGVAIDGSLASFKLAIAPLEIGGVFDPLLTECAGALFAIPSSKWFNSSPIDH